MRTTAGMLAMVKEPCPRLGEHNVARLQIPMHHTLAMGLVECVGDLDGVSKRLIEGECPFFQP